MAYKRFKITDDEAAQIVTRRADIRGQRAERRALDLQVVRSLNFFAGRQHFVFDDRTGRIREPRKLPPYAILYTANLIKGDVLRAVQTVAGAHADFVVAPQKNTRTSKYGAWVSEKLMLAIAENANMPELDQLATLIAAICGSVIWRVSWNPDIGDKTRFYFDDDKGTRFLRAEDIGEEERIYKEREGLFEDRPQGDVDYDLVNLFGARWDWSARDRGLTSANWFVDNQFVDFDWIEERYGPAALDGMQADEVPDGSLYYEELMSHLTSSFGFQGFGQGQATVQDKQGRRCVHSELFERPLPANGMMGRRIVYAGGKLLHQGPNPYREIDMPLPFVKQDWVQMPMRFWGLSLVEDLINPQQHYNRMRGNVAEHVRIFGHPAYFVRKNSGVPTGYFTIQPGAVVEFDGPSPPVAGPTPNLPKEVTEHTLTARGEIAEISSQQSLDASKLPGQIRSAPGLDIMVEERNKLLAHPAQNFVLTKHRIGKITLQLAQRFYPDARVISYVGEDRQYRVLKFRKADIHTDLRVLYDRSRMLQSPAAARAKVMEMVQLGILDPINNPEDKETVLSTLEFGSAQQLISRRLIEEENQDREIEEMEADPLRWIEPRADASAPLGPDGQPAMTRGYPIGPFDDDTVHLRGCIDFIRSEEYRRADPITQTLVEMHAQAHQKRIEQKQMQAMMMQAALGGGGSGQKGRPSQPRQPSPSPTA